MSLQFGHGGEAVENIRSRWKRQKWAALQFGHGGEAVENLGRRERTPDAWRLQFGHGGEAVENHKNTVLTHQVLGFNSATAVRPWKTARDAADRGRAAEASIRPRR